MLRLSVEEEGSARIVRGVRDVEESVRSIRPVARDLQDVFFEIEARGFESGGASTRGGKWKENTESTQRKKGFFGGFPLHDTLKLKASLTRRGAEYQVFEVNDDSITMGTSRPGALANQRGFTVRTKGGTRRVEPRRAISHTDADYKAFLKALRRHYQKEAKRAGFVQTGEMF